MTTRTGRLTRRHLLGAAAAAGTLAASDAAMAQGGGFVVGTFGGPYEQILRRHILAGFDRANGVQTRLEFGLGTTFMQRMIASRNRSPYNVIVVNEDEALVGVDMNLFAPLAVDRLANAPQVHAALMPPNVAMYGTMLFELTCVYNANRTEAPRSWADLWKPGLKVGVAHPHNAYGLLFLQIAAEVAGGGINKLTDGLAQIRKLENFKIYRGVVDGIQLFRTGEIDIGLFYRNRAIQLAEEGFPIRFAAPREGAFGHRSGLQVPRAQPQAGIDLAFKWVDMALSADYQRHFAEALYSPSNRTLELPPALAAKHIYGAEAVNALRFPAWATINAQKAEIYDRWDREFVM